MTPPSQPITQLSERIAAFTRVLRDEGIAFYSVFFYPQIPSAKLVNATSSYANFNRRKDFALLLVDDTVFRSAKNGFLLTTRSLFYRLTKDGAVFAKCNGKASLKDVRSLEISRSKSALVMNGSVLGSLTLVRDEQRVLNAFLDATFAENREVTKEDISKALDPEKHVHFVKEIAKLAGQSLPRETQWDLMDDYQADEAVVEVINRVVLTTHRIFDLRDSWSIRYEDFLSTEVYKNYGPMAPLGPAPSAIKVLATLGKVAYKAIDDSNFAIKIFSKTRFSHTIIGLTRSAADGLSNTIHVHANQIRRSP